MKATKLTKAQMIADSQREYNPTEWEKIIERYSNYANCIFYKIPSNDVYSYDRFFATYTTKEGLNLFGSVSYSSCITNGGFYKANIIDGFAIENDEIIKLEDGEVFISIGKMLFKNLQTGEYETHVINTSKAACEMMIEKSVKYGLIFTKEAI
jgi:hypothetical protein